MHGELTLSDLKDGTYYLSKEDEVTAVNVQKGMIELKDIPYGARIEVCEIKSPLGYIVGNEMDKFDRQQLNNVYETGVSGRPSTWNNPDTGNRYSVTPQPAVQGPRGGTCRRAEIQAVIDGRRETTYSTACRDDYGQWVLQ